MHLTTKIGKKSHAIQQNIVPSGRFKSSETVEINFCITQMTVENYFIVNPDDIVMELCLDLRDC